MLGPEEPFLKHEQDQAVFALTAVDMTGFSGCAPLGMMYDEILSGLQQHPKWKGARIALVEAHILFGCTRMTHFDFHQDSGSFNKKQPDLTVVCHVSRGKGSMWVAGATDEHLYEGAGACSLFDARLWHRSGVSQRGTVKLSLFFKVDDLINPVKREEPGTSSSVADKDASGDSGSDGSDDGEPLRHRLSSVQAAMMAGTSWDTAVDLVPKK